MSNSNVNNNAHSDSCKPLSQNGFTTHLGIEYLAKRVVTLDMARNLGMEFVTHQQANDYLRTAKSKRSYHSKYDALWVPDRCADGTFHPYHGQAIFFTPGKKPYKLHTETTVEHPNEVHCLPLPGGLAYSMLPADTKIYWCESVIKAAVPNQHFGFPAIGMNGVFGFSRKGGALCNEATKMPARAVHIYIADSLNRKNRKSMTNVLRARNKWYIAMKKQYPESSFYYIELPPPPAGWPKDDWGLDDFCATNGAEKTKELLLGKLQEFRQTSELGVWLDDFNSRFVYVKQVSKIYDIQENQLLSKTDFLNNYAPFRCTNGEGEAVSIPNAWFNWIERLEVSGLAFRPGEELLTEGRLNLWQGFAVAPDTSDAGQAEVQKYWVDTIYDTFGPDGKHFIEFCAALVQHPEKRLSRYFFLGGRPGTGKNYAAEPICQIMGPHFQAFTVDNFINNFNMAHHSCRLGLLNETGDPNEIPKAVRTAIGEQLKKNADQNEKTMQLEPKGKDISTVDRLQSNIVISNYGFPGRLDPDDRRAVCLRAGKHMAIKSSNNDGEKTLEFWAERWQWLNYGGGAAGVLGYLLNYDLSGVDIDGPAPMTDYKKLLIGQRGTSAETFVMSFGRAPLEIFQEALGVKNMDAYRLKEGADEYVFEATDVARCYSILVESVDNHKALATSIGKWAVDMWEVGSVQISGRDVTTGSMGGARVYGIKDGKVVSADAVGTAMSKTDKLQASHKLKQALLGVERTLHNAPGAKF